MAKATTEKTVRFFDKTSFDDWLSDLNDVVVVKAITNRVRRVEEGNLGDYASVGDGVFELRLHIGPGYRVYFANEASEIIIILHSGSKKRQQADIGKAKEIWQEIKNEQAN